MKTKRKKKDIDVYTFEQLYSNFQEISALLITRWLKTVKAAHAELRQMALL